MIEYLRYNDAAPDGQPLELFAVMPWSTYVEHMSTDGFYEDEITPL